MQLNRRQALVGALAMPAILKFPRQARAAQTLKISHQFPGGTIEQGDFRDRLCRLFARDVAKQTKDALAFEIFPNSSLMKTNAQFSALRKGGLDMSLYPIAYAGGEVHACNLGLMPCLVTSYEQGAKWKNAEIGKAFSKIVEDKGVKIIAWIWQAGGIASRDKKIVSPDDVKGVKIRGGSREMDRMFAAAGAQVSTMPSNEIYIGMQTGSLDAAVTSSTSLVSFRLEELAKSLTAPKGASFWFMLEPLLMSKAVFDGLPADQQKAIMDVGAQVEAFGQAEAKKDDETLQKVYAAKGCDIAAMDEAAVAKWRPIAEEAAWKDFGAKSSESAELIKLAKQVQ